MAMNTNFPALDLPQYCQGEQHTVTEPRLQDPQGFSPSFDLSGQG